MISKKAAFVLQPRIIEETCYYRDLWQKFAILNWFFVLFCFFAICLCCKLNFKVVDLVGEKNHIIAIK